jgi:hypothetical protein
VPYVAHSINGVKRFVQVRNAFLTKESQHTHTSATTLQEPKALLPSALEYAPTPNNVCPARKPDAESVLVYATSWMTPPASLILRSASADTNRARTTRGALGRRPLPSTLEYPKLSRSSTGAVSLLLPVRNFSRCSAGTRLQSCGSVSAMLGRGR